MRFLNYLVMTGLMLSAGGACSDQTDRWYTSDQVEKGEVIFRQQCAACHGQNAEATENWKKTDANGKYPPPPLNGTAHTWHHDRDTLRLTIREGGVKLGGQMPGFEGLLNAEQIDSVIAFFQSKWPEDVYQRWAERFEVSNLPSIEQNVSADENPVTVLLRQRIGNASIGDVQKSPVGDVWQVKIGNQYVYLLDNGKYALTGDLVNLENGENLTERSRRKSTIDTISEFNDEDLVVFAASGEARATLNVFTDTSCPYCQKMHSEIGNLQEAGITVRYIPFARGGKNGPGYETLKSVWCAKDREKAMTDAKNDIYTDLPSGDCAKAAMIDRGYRAGNLVGIRGTPALVKSNGEKIEGYVPYRELIPQILQGLN